MPFADEHQSPAESLDWIMHSMASWLLRETLNLGIWHTETGHYLGGIGIHPHNWAARSFEIGYWLRVSAAGQGYITEAAGLVVAYLFDQLEAKRVQICCDERNLRSAAVARRLGFIQEGRLRNDQLTPTGTLRTTLIFGMIPADRSR
jgi:RimJ/RimL family protein N-acetyltransferase